MILAHHYNHRRQSVYEPPLAAATTTSSSSNFDSTSTSTSSHINNIHHYTNNLPSQKHQFIITPQSHDWSSIVTIPSPPHSHHNDITASNNPHNIYSFDVDQPLFDYQQSHDYTSSSLMQTEQANNGWYPNGRLTPTSSSARARRHRESSLSSRGSVGPASPYTVNISNPQVAGELYHDFQDFYQQQSKPLTPAHTPSQDQFLAPPHYYNSNMPSVGPDIKVDAMAAPGRQLNQSVASHDSPSASTPPGYEVEERRNHAYRNTMPKLDRTMTDAYQDELYNPSFHFTSTSSTTMGSIPATVAPMNDIFAQRLQAANSQHLSVSNPQASMTIPSRERSPFREGSAFAPSAASYAPQPSNNFKFGTASHMREQQKAENDARVLREQWERSSPAQNTPKTISPKDVDLVYHESEEDARMPLFPASASPPPARQYPFAAAALPPQPSLTPQRTREEFPASLTSMESSSSEYAPVQQRPASPRAARASRTSPSHSGPYTCTYHGCTMRFETPVKLQRHKREGHRSSVSVTAPVARHDDDSNDEDEQDEQDEGGMTSAALRNTQSGPHKCSRTNPSTGKPCNTIFSRPYDLTRHEDTIHNARRQKVRCHLCTEEKTFSRNDALTRHFRACHPDRMEMNKARRRNARD